MSSHMLFCLVLSPAASIVVVVTHLFLAQIQCYVVICDAFQAECHPGSAAQQWKSDVVNMAPSLRTLTKHVQFYRCKKQPTPPTFCFPWVIYLIFSLSRALCSNIPERKTTTVWEEEKLFVEKGKVKSSIRKFFSSSIIQNDDGTDNLACAFSSSFFSTVKISSIHSHQIFFFFFA